MRCPACKPSTRVSRVWLKSDSLRPLGKSWPGKLLTRQKPRMQIRTSPGRDGRQPRLAWWSPVSDAEGALLRSQGGPLASAPFLSFPMSRFARLEPQALRVLFLRRLRLPLPLTARACRCGRPLDALGHHRSACAVAGTLGREGFPLENAAARICREAGGRVRTNVYVRGMDLGVVNQFDTRRLEVVVDGLPLFQRAQLEVDTTVVCPLTKKGAAQPRSPVVSGACFRVARRRKETRYPELVGDGGRARLVVLAVGGRRTLLRGNCLVPPEVWRQRKCVTCPSCCRDPPAQRGCVGGVPCWPVLQRVLSRSPFSTGTVLQGWMVLRLPSTRCWEIPATSCEVQAPSLCCDWCLTDFNKHNPRQKKKQGGLRKRGPSSFLARAKARSEIHKLRNEFNKRGAFVGALSSPPPRHVLWHRPCWNSLGHAGWMATHLRSTTWSRISVSPGWRREGERVAVCEV